MKFRTIAVQVMKSNRFQTIFFYQGDLQTVVNYDSFKRKILFVL